MDDKIYPINVTSSYDISSFIERQPDYVRADYELLSQALEEEFSDYISQTGLTTALAVKQGKQEPRQP